MPVRSCKSTSCLLALALWLLAAVCTIGAPASLAAEAGAVSGEAIGESAVATISSSERGSTLPVWMFLADGVEASERTEAELSDDAPLESDHGDDDVATSAVGLPVVPRLASAVCTACSPSHGLSLVGRPVLPSGARAPPRG